MIKFINISPDAPYARFEQEYQNALQADQNNIEAISISSYSSETLEVNSRLVNLKFIDNKDFIFFSNYESPKAKEFDSHDQIAATFFWFSINLQIRMKAKIKKTSLEFNNLYFYKRSSKKNALAISSKQSERIESYKSVKENYNKCLEFDDLKQCPDYWGGYLFTPYYFEFWEGHESRLNKREVYKALGDEWEYYIIQP